jgi:hypothetical protein
MKFAMDNALYVVVPYFNFVGYRSGVENLEQFLTRLRGTAGLEIILVEGYCSEQLDDYSSRVFKHVRVHVPDVLWVKENLINIGFKYMPSSWKYAGWFDRDIAFLNPCWLEETKKVLASKDIVQPWSQCIYLNNSFEQSPVVVKERNHNFAESLSNLHSRGILTAKNRYRDRYTQPGQAWTITREAYENLGGLYDKAILGGADSLWGIGLLGVKDSCVLTGIEQDVQEYLRKVFRLNVGRVNGALVHYYHGEAKNRQYVARHEILRKHNYSPSTFLKYTEEGVLCYTEQGKAMEEDVVNYFISREED